MPIPNDAPDHDFAEVEEGETATTPIERNQDMLFIHQQFSDEPLISRILPDLEQEDRVRRAYRWHHQYTTHMTNARRRMILRTNAQRDFIRPRSRNGSPERSAFFRKPEVAGLFNIGRTLRPLLATPTAESFYAAVEAVASHSVAVQSLYSTADYRERDWLCDCSLLTLHEVLERVYRLSSYKAFHAYLTYHIAAPNSAAGLTLRGSVLKDMASRHGIHIKDFNPLHYVRKSDDPQDPAKIAYLPDARHLFHKDQEGNAKPRWVRTTVGKYLTKFAAYYSTEATPLSEAQIRTVANAWTEATKPIELHIVSNTAPDMWEWVYENGSSFQSCMTYDRSGRYLHSTAHGLNHPVRAYATDHEENTLGLAWLGTLPDRDENGKPIKGTGSVGARSLVCMASESYIKIYGDDRIVTALDLQGYTHRSHALDGQVLRVRQFHGDEYYVPYLDNCGTVSWYDEDDSLIVISGDSDGASTNSNGLCDIDSGSNRCDECGDRTSDDLTHVDCEDIHVCDHCLSHNFTYAYGRRHQEYFRSEDVIECSSDDEMYHENWLSYHGIVQDRDGAYYFVTDCVYLDETGEYIYNDDARELDVPFGADEAAHRDDVVITGDDLAIHATASIKDGISGKLYHLDHMLCVLDPFLRTHTGRPRFLYVHPTTIATSPDALSVVTLNQGVHVLYRTSIDTPVDTLLSDWLAARCRSFEDCETVSFANMTAMDDASTATMGLVEALWEATPTILTNIIPLRIAA